MLQPSSGTSSRTPIRDPGGAGGGVSPWVPASAGMTVGRGSIHSQPLSGAGRRNDGESTPSNPLAPTRPMPSRIAMWTLALGLVAGAGWLWPDVPARIPVHFGLSGEPDRWVERSLLGWLELPLVGLALAAVMEGTAWWIQRPGAPGLNLPNKDAVLALPPERQRPVVGRVVRWLYRLGGVVAVGFVLIQVGAWRAAHGVDGSDWVLAGALGTAVASVLALPWMLVDVNAELKRQQAAAGGAA